MFYGGESNVAGAIGNLGAYGNMIAGLDLPYTGGRLNRSGDLREKTRPFGQIETMPTRPMRPDDYKGSPAIDVRLSQAGGFTGAVGNMGGLLAQALPNAAADLGPEMQMMPSPNVFSVRPRINYMDPEQGGLELGGSVNIPIGARGRINVQGGYQPDTRKLKVNATVGQPPGAEGFGFDFNMERRLGGQGNTSPYDYGVMGRYGTQF